MEAIFYLDWGMECVFESKSGYMGVIKGEGRFPV